MARTRSRISAAAPAAAAVSMVAKNVPIPSLGFDTSENLSAAHYDYLVSAGFKWGCRYVPLAGQSSTANGVIQPAELANALARKLGMMFVQFARTSPITAAQGAADGKAAATYVLQTLKAPNTTCLWCDMGLATRDATIAYVNAWYQGTIDAGMSPAAAGVYFEPGVPLTSSERFSLIN